MIENPAITLTRAFSLDRIEIGLFEIPTSAFLHRPYNLIRFSDSPACTCIMQITGYKYAATCQHAQGCCHAIQSDGGSIMRKVSLLPFFFSFALSLHVSLSLFCLPLGGSRCQSQPMASSCLITSAVPQRDRQTDKQTDRQRAGVREN